MEPIKINLKSTSSGVMSFTDYIQLNFGSGTYKKDLISHIEKQEAEHNVVYCIDNIEMLKTELEKPNIFSLAALIKAYQDIFKKKQL